MGGREFIVFMALVSAMSALAIDMLLPAFASIREHFGLEPDAKEVSLTLTLFFFGSAIGYLIYGPLADAFGRKAVLAGSMALYAAAAFLSALAPSLAVLYAGRFVWGFAASGARVVTQAIVRDRFKGDAMARVMTLIQSVFFAAPIVAPIIGRLIVEFGSWRWVMAFGVLSALAVFVWSLRLPETLEPENRRPLEFGVIVTGFRVVLTNRVALGYGLAVTFGLGSLFAFLGSSELIFEDVYDKSEWFVPFFSTMALVMAATAFTANRILHRISARQLALRASCSYVVAAAVMLVVSVANNGRPPLLLWLVLLALTISSFVMMFPTTMSLALEPMGALAGTAAAVLGFITASVGAFLGSLVDRSIDGSVTPMGIAYLTYATIALALQLWARQESGRANRASKADN